MELTYGEVVGMENREAILITAAGIYGVLPVCWAPFLVLDMYSKTK